MTLEKSDQWQERTAILTHDAGVEVELAKAAAFVFCLNPPSEIQPEAWQRLMDIMGVALDDIYNPLEGRI